MLGGELGNSSASNLQDLKRTLPKLAAMGLDTVLVPVSWELIEPEEGKWDFRLLAGTLREARKHKLHLVLDSAPDNTRAAVPCLT
jgi:beta-galactosidase GanA